MFFFKNIVGEAFEEYENEPEPDPTQKIMNSLCKFHFQQIKELIRQI
jgi:hypothetical protein